ncbi:hypothetical protein GYB22_13235 [bacterium]|nr:hypothetical protein [bacterium]
MRRKAFGIAFLVLLVLPVILLLLGFKHQQHQIRRAVKHQIIQGIEKEQLSLIKIHLKDAQQLSWKHSKEFKYRGEMYDVVYRDTTGDTLIYYCWWDNKETALNKQLSLAVTKYFGTNNQNDKQKNKLQHFIKTLICVEAFESVYICPSSSSDWEDVIYRCLKIFPDHELPPPRLA